MLRPRWTGVVFLLLACLFPATASALVEPIGRGNYSTETICERPPLESAGCLADGLVPETPAAQSRSYPIGMILNEAPAHGTAAEGVYGLRPEDLHALYELPQNSPSKQTIGVVEAYDDPTIENDLRIYDEEFGLPPCTEANGCFRKVNKGNDPSPLPPVNARWAAETSLDVEIAHAVCPNCDIVLVEADTNSYQDLEIVLSTALTAGATEISSNFGSENNFETSRYDHPGVVITAATGDSGYRNWEDAGLAPFASYPASSPYVVAVGGTTVVPFLGAWVGEEAWSHTGSGCGMQIGGAPSWQIALPNWAQGGCGSERADADIAADADPVSGVAIYDSTPLAPWFPGWATLGGTSLASSIVNAAFALAGGSRRIAFPAQTAYAHLGQSSLHDIVSGSNYPESSCQGAWICSAGPGFDGPTGVGTLRGVAALEPFSGTEPTVTGISPANGLSKGGQTVEITGTHLAGATAVEFGEAEGSIVTDEDDAITAETPRHRGEVVDVTVRGSGGIPSEISPADKYEYAALTPVVNRVTPPSGPPLGGTLVTIEGTGLGEVSMVEFSAGYFVIPSSVTENRVTAISPPHPEGAVRLRLVGQFSSGETFYTYGGAQHETLAIHTAGSGQGTVTVAPFGAACSSDCVQSLGEGSALTLSATPRSGSSFAGWSGEGCTGTAFCHFILHGNGEITATFLGSTTSGNQASKKPAPNGESLRLHAVKVRALKGCLAAAKKAYRHAAHLARSAGSRRAAALSKAKRAQYKADVACRRRY